LKPLPYRISLVLSVLMVAGCASEDYSAKNISGSFKGGVDWVRDAFGQPVADVSKEGPLGPFPNPPSDPRPEIRSEKQHDIMVADLKGDLATAAKISTAVKKSDDQTQYISFNGAPPTAQPIALTVETISLPDGVRDMDTVDRTRLDSWSEVATLQFREGSAELPEDATNRLSQAVRLAEAHLDARVVGYSASDRLTMPGKGPHEANRWLADLRARKVALELVHMGVAPAKLIVGSAPEADRKSGDKVEIIIDY